jgi:protein TonB
MDRQLFSQTSRVSTGTRTGAVPVSVAVHAIAIGGAFFVSAAMTTAPPPPPQPPRAQLTAPPPTVVRVAPMPTAPPPKGSGPRHVVKNTTSVPPVAPAPVKHTPDPDHVVEDPRVVPDPGPSEFDFGRNTGPACQGCVVDPNGPVGNPGGDPNGTGPVRVHEGINAPRAIVSVKPVYPPIAIQSHIEGDVELDCVIAPNGEVREVRVLRGHPLFKTAAVDAVRQWRYTPPRLNDTPISVLLTVTVRFRLTR